MRPGDECLALLRRRGWRSLRRHHPDTNLADHLLPDVGRCGKVGGIDCLQAETAGLQPLAVTGDAVAIEGCAALLIGSNRRGDWLRRGLGCRGTGGALLTCVYPGPTETENDTSRRRACEHLSSHVLSRPILRGSGRRHLGVIPGNDRRENHPRCLCNCAERNVVRFSQSTPIIPPSHPPGYFPIRGSRPAIPAPSTSVTSC